ncbi:hydantoinase B/oxoprolinase family protein [Rhodopila sp.]|uniref:hydantoinase B/oxoprolinase family protein n=1 Tax=Rhodopila sp. TaxID=2480087 RepID=UPI003D0C4F13
MICDPVTLEIIRGATRAAQAEMEALLERTAISAFIREKKDFYTAVFDSAGRLAVGSNVPVFGDVTAPVLAAFPIETMQPGDLYWFNDCYGSQGAVSHSNDQVFLAPVFHAGELCAFVMGWAHFADIGGLRPGSISPDTTDIFQEGIIIPPTKLATAGILNEAVLTIFHRNSRFPEQSLGDTRALMASVDVGVRRMAEILQRFGGAVVADALHQLLARTEALVRERLRETFAPGTHEFTDVVDADGHGNGPFHLRLAMTRTTDDRFILDTTRTDDQAAGPVNYLMNPQMPGTALGLFFLGGDASQVCNAGGAQAIDEVRLREGSLLAPRFPAPLGLRGVTMMRMLAALNGLVNVAGGSAPASHSAYVIILLRGMVRGHGFLMSDGVGVGYGARPDSDGIDAVYFVAQENYPVEFLELNYPVRLLKYGINRDSGGSGLYRGGCGLLREYEVLADSAMLSMRIDGVDHPSWGVAGGKSGGSGRATVNPGTPKQRRLVALSDRNILHRGDVLRLETGGGGGHGHPFDRPPERVLDDVLDGFVSTTAALEQYGVVIRDGSVDAAATLARRTSRPPAKAFHRGTYVDVLD